MHASVCKYNPYCKHLTENAHKKVDILKYIDKTEKKEATSYILYITNGGKWPFTFAKTQN